MKRQHRLRPLLVLALTLLALAPVFPRSEVTAQGLTARTHASSRFQPLSSTTTPHLVGAPSAAPPTNDAFAAAQAITTLPFNTSENTAGATLEAAEPQPGCTTGITATVWFKVTPSSTVPLTLSTVGSSYTLTASQHATD